MMTGLAGDGWLEQSAGTIPGTVVPAFSLRSHPAVPVPVVIAVPHAGRAYPPELAGQMRHPEHCAMRLEDRLIDRVARAAAEQSGAALLLAHAPRALIDLNRAPDDIDWSMIAGGAPPGARHSLANRRARSGLGLVPRRLPGVGEIWRQRIGRDELEARVAGIHAPYHRALGDALHAIRDRWGAALLIDLHSMPPLHPQGERPSAEFVVGDRFGASCQRGLVSTAAAFIEGQGRPVALNRPYAGGYVLDRHGQPARGLHAMQIEVCRSAYLDAALAEPSARLPAVARLIAGLVRQLAGEVARLGAGRLPLAAE